MKRPEGNRRRSAAVPLVLIIGGAFAVVAAWSALRPAPATQIIFHAYPPRLVVSDLIDQGTVIAVVRPTGIMQAHWNNAANRQWEAVEGSGLTPMIVTDNQVRVVRGFRGASESELVTIRTIGGTVGTIQFLDVDAQPLLSSETYLVFLARQDWHGEDVVDRAVLSPLGGTQSIYTAKDPSSFLNREGLFMSLAQLEALAQ